MRILVVLNSSGFFRHFDTVVRSLCQQGHAVKVLTRMISKGDADEGYQGEMSASLAGIDNGSYDFGLRKRRDRLGPYVRDLRGAVNYAIYLRPQHNSPHLAERLAPACPARLRAFFATRAGRRLVASDGFLRAYRRLQASLPADPALVAQVAGERPDVVVACPFVYTMCTDVEYVRAAQKLGIPTVAAVASWDNLSTKGAFHLLPDRILVWNDRLAEEAEAIHAVPPERIASTGAAKFDAYFELEPSQSREEFCAGIGIDSARPYLLYLGSSEQVAGDETGFVRELAGALRGDPRTAEVHVVVRPHPLNGRVWKGFDHPDITVFPRRAQRPDMAGPRLDYFNTLSYATAALGVNTTALLEAAVADRPCLSIVSERHRQGQAERGHFQHLLQGGFMETVPDFAGAVEALATLIDGHDARRAGRRRFVESFLRPAGRNRRAGHVMAEAIVAAGRRRAQAGAATPTDAQAPGAAVRPAGEAGPTGPVARGSASR